jgi:Zn-dependent peptidase ImmA (M78 family)
VYIDNRLHPGESTFAASIIVHEFVHYLQQSGGKFALEYNCNDALEMEREAYYVQSRFLEAHGVYWVVGSAMYFSSCAP